MRFFYGDKIYCPHEQENLLGWRQIFCPEDKTIYYPKYGEYKKLTF